MFVVFDLDGTLADDRHRLHLINCAEPDYAAYTALCSKDAPIWAAVKTLQAHAAFGHRVEVWTGRQESARGDTERWLPQYGISPDILSRMRLPGDVRPGPALKRAWLREEGRRGAIPDLAYDDRGDCAEMWRSRGVQCFLIMRSD